MSEATTLYERHVAAANERFERMTDAQRRQAIAEDVLDRLYRGQLQAATATGYVESDEFTMLQICTVEVSAEVKDTPMCTVCGIGGLFIGAVAQFDKLPESKMEDAVFLGSECYALLHNYFDHETLRCIEAAFEGSLVAGGNIGTPEGVEVNAWRVLYAARWFDINGDKKWYKANNRLAAIAANIYYSFGDFELKQPPWTPSLWKGATLDDAASPDHIPNDE